MDWISYDDFADKTDTYCWAEIRCSGPQVQHKTYVTMAHWWEGSLYDAIDGCNIDRSDQIPLSKVIGVMPIDKPEPVYVPVDNVRQIK